ncbi:MAG TPA: mechanosensitive ion channel domain-containing protein [Steroidobacteraceae bacterium]|jgi:small-conductance mechanosensitive channel|nr:mechanosensitive ion channel domain-containing protein [Steroidobacteraceae bacterium]
MRRATKTVHLLIGLGLCAIACAAVAAEEIDTATAARDSARIVIANRTVIEVRGPIAGYSATERATASTNRIIDVLEANPSPAIKLDDIDEGTEVLLGGKRAFIVTRIDIDPIAGETTQLVAEAAATRLGQAVAEYRAQHTPRYLLIQTGWALVALAIYSGLLWLLIQIDRRVGRLVAGAAAAGADRLHVKGVRLFDPEQISLFARRLFTGLAYVLGFIATYGWITFTLLLFPYTRPSGEQMEGQLLGIVGDMALSIANAIPGLLLVIVILLIARLIIRLASLFFDRIARGKISMGGLDADTVVPTRRIFQFVVWAFAAALAYPYLPGSDTDAFKGVSVLFGLAVSIGASSLVGQAVSGLILTYTRAFRPGEYVRIGDTEGTVVAMGAFATRVRTGLGEEVLVPNTLGLQNSTQNFSRAAAGGGFVVNTRVAIGYSTPWRQVHALLEEAARRTAGIDRDPEPYVRQTALADFYVEYRLIAHSLIDDPAERIKMLSALYANIQDVFNEHGVQILSPHYMTDPAESQVVTKERWYTPPAKPPAI